MTDTYQLRYVIQFHVQAVHSIMALDFLLSGPQERKILVFFVVDPQNKDVFDTSEVPEQNRSVIAATVSFALDKMCQQQLNTRFPEHLSEQIAKMLPGFSEEEAKQHRAELMDERKRYKAKFNEDREISLCEH